MSLATSLAAREPVLLIDDDLALGGLLSQFLGPESFNLTVAPTGEEGVPLALQRSFALIILDVMLPGIDGFEVLRRIRLVNNTPIIMLTTRGAGMDRVQGLEQGADDYLPKPFQPEELLARIRSILRRVKPRFGKMAYITVGDLELDAMGRRIRIAGKEVEITGAEFELLQILVSQPGEVFEREELVRRVFDRGLSVVDRSIDTLVSNLRKKLGSHPWGADRIRSVRGVGYTYVIDRAALAE